MSDPGRHLSLSSDRNFHFERPPTPLPSQIKTDDDLHRWRQEHAAATLRVPDLERERRRILASATIEAIRKLDDELATARVRVERAAAVIETAEAKFAELAERERAAQPERRRKHRAAMKARDEAERILREVYGPAAQTIADALAQLSGLQAIIDAAGEPPEGEARVPSYETFRHPPEAGCGAVTIALASAVCLPPVVRTEPNFWPVPR